MEKRSYKDSDELKQFVGNILTKEMLFGRGYFHEKEGKVFESHFPHIPGVYYDHSQDLEEGEDIGITCDDVLEYIAYGIGENFSDDSEIQHWVKCIPAAWQDFENCEVYILILINCIEKGDCLEIQDISVHGRRVKQLNGGWYSVPGEETLESHFFEMDIIPPEPFEELNMLIKGRFIPEDFKIFGNPEPKNVDKTNDPKNSGYRFAYFNIYIHTDDNNLINDIEIESNARSTSMFERPRMKYNDPRDDFDCVVLYCDQYSDEEWQEIIKE